MLSACICTWPYVCILNSKPLYLFIMVQTEKAVKNDWYVWDSKQATQKCAYNQLLEVIIDCTGISSEISHDWIKFIVLY